MDINKILKSVNIVDVVKQYLPIQKKGQNYLAICPFHNDTKPSLSISESKQIYKCFVCNHSGNAIKFIMDYKHINFLSALEELKKNFNLDIEISNQKENYESFRMYELNKLVSSWFFNFLHNKENKYLIEYLNNRKIDDELIKKFQIGFAPNERDLIYQLAINKNNLRNLSLDNETDVYSLTELKNANIITVLDDGNVVDFFRNRIMIPIYDEYDNVIAFSGRAMGESTTKYLNSPSSIIFKKTDVLYNINNLDSSNNNACLVEGFFDVFSLEKIGFKNSLATMGTSFNINHVKLLKSKKIKNVVLALDLDNAGLEAEYKIALLLKQNNINIFHFQTSNLKFKDFNELLIDNEEELINYTSQQEDYCLYLIKRKINENQTNNKQELFDELIRNINDLGSSLYLNDYFDILKTKFNINEDEIKPLINLKIKNQEIDYNQFFDEPKSKKVPKDDELDKLNRLISNYKNLYVEFFKHSFFSKELFLELIRETSVECFNQVSEKLNKKIDIKSVSNTFSNVNNFIYEFYKKHSEINAIINQTDDYYDLFIKETKISWLDDLLSKEVYLKIKNDKQTFNSKTLIKNILNLRVLEIKLMIEIEYQNIQLENHNKDYRIFLDEKFIRKIETLRNSEKDAEKKLKKYIQSK